LEEEDGQFSAFELKWNPKAKARFPKTFMEAYKPKSTNILHRDNFWEYIDK